MSLEENFLYPLFLLLIGGGISGILIPWVTRIQEQKNKRIEQERATLQRKLEQQRETNQRKLEQQRETNQRKLEQQKESRQREIDRVREDLRFELGIKNELRKEISTMSSSVFEASNDLMFYANTKEEKDKIIRKTTNLLIKNFNSVLSSIQLFFENKSEMASSWTYTFEILQDCVSLAATKNNSVERKEQIIVLIKKLDLNPNAEELELLENGQTAYDLIAKGSATITKFLTQMTNEKVHTPLAEEHYNKTGKEYFKQDRKKEALKYFEESLKINPINTDAIYNKAVCLGHLGKFENSISLLNNFIDLRGPDANAFYMKSLFHLYLKQDDESYRSLTKAIQLDFSYKEEAKNQEEFKVLMKQDSRFKLLLE